MQTADQIRNRIDSLTVDDAVIASAILSEISAGHEEFADRLARMGRLGWLTNDELAALCARYGVEV